MMYSKINGRIASIYCIWVVQWSILDATYFELINRVFLILRENWENFIHHISCNFLVLFIIWLRLRLCSTNLHDLTTENLLNLSWMKDAFAFGLNPIILFTCNMHNKYWNKHDNPIIQCLIHACNYKLIQFKIFRISCSCLQITFLELNTNALLLVLKMISFNRNPIRSFSEWINS